jgi:hypothetical protein
MPCNKWVNEGASECFTPNEQLFRNIITRTSNILLRWRWWLLYTRPLFLANWSFILLLYDSWAPSYAILLQVTTRSLYQVQLGTVVPLYIEYHIHIFTNRQLVVQGNRSVLLLEVKLRTMVPLGFAKPIQKFPRHQNHRMLRLKIDWNIQ